MRKVHRKGKRKSNAWDILRSVSELGESAISEGGSFIKDNGIAPRLYSLSVTTANIRTGVHDHVFIFMKGC
jgi:hypothetical protein